MTGRLLLLAVLAAGVVQEPLTFEAASVKISKPGTAYGGGGGPGTPDPGQYSALGMPLSALLLRAYRVSQYELVAPSWMATSHYDVIAKVPAGTTEKQFDVMLQNLLVERFKLASHRERRELPAYDLAIAKGGPKVKKADDAPPGGDGDHLSPPHVPYTVGPDGFPILHPMPGALSGSAMAPNGRVTEWIGKVTMAQFAAYQRAHTGRPVVDKTGLTGRYDITIRFLYNVNGPGDETAPAYDFPEAVERQLGLKFVMTKAPVDVLVIDHAEKVPVEN